MVSKLTYQQVQAAQAMAKEEYHMSADFLNRLAQMIQFRQEEAPVQTPEERVTVTHDAKWSRVFLDGDKVISFEVGVTADTDSMDHAERYRLGLIATLKGGK